MTLLETIKCENGKLTNLRFHQERFELARKELGFFETILLKDCISIPKKCRKGLFRCRVLYSKQIEKIEFVPHQFRKIQTLKLVYDNDIDYHLKFSQRDYLDHLFNKRENCDDILIVKNGFITDSWTANPVFFDGLKWWTPNTPLLPGTQRAKLLAEGKIAECAIKPEDFSKFQKIGLVNAFQDLNNMPVISIVDVKK